MISRLVGSLSLFHRLARDERGRVAFGLAAGLVTLAALAAMVFSISTALAHHPTYTATADCYGWDAVSTYVGGSELRLILISDVVINGAPYQPSWSNAPSQSGGTPPRTSGVIAYNSYGGPKTGLPAWAGAGEYLWVGISSGWTIFDLDETVLGPLQSPWDGELFQYYWTGSQWVEGGGFTTYIHITMPTAPTNCSRIIIDKVTDPRHDPQSFNFTLTKSGFSRSFSLTDDATPWDSGLISAGTYNASETVPAGWVKTGATCDDGSPVDAISLQLGETVTCTFTNTLPPGKIIVKKVTVGGDASFTFDPSYGPDFNLSNGQQNDSGPLAPGAYSVAEINIPAGWQLTSAVCDDGSPVNNIGLGAGETVTCTFTNTLPPGKIIVKKVTVGGDASFTFDTSYGPDFNLSNGQQNDSGPLTPGSYSVAESAIPQGWDLTSAVCDDGSPVNNIGLGAGETVTCTFTNTARGRIIIDKVTDPSGDPQSFAFTLTGGPSALNQAFSLTDVAAPHDSGFVLPGSGYAAAETVPSGWDLTGATCDDGSPVNNISVSPGETVTCTFTNTLRRGTIIVEKQTIPDGAAGSFTYTGDAAGTIGDGGQIVVSNLLPGTYTSTEADPTAALFDLTSIVCDDTDSTGDVGTRTATFHLAAGETVKCVFTNVKTTLTLVKIVINDDGGTLGVADFPLFIDGAPATSGIAYNVTANVVHIASETQRPGYIASTWAGDCAADGTVTLLPGDNKVCVITNDDVPFGTVIVEKQTVPDGADGTFTFTGDLSGSLQDNGQIVLTNLQPGTYFSFEANMPVGFTLTSIVCDDDNSEGDVAAAKATIRLDANEHVVKCVFTNTLPSTTPTPSPTPSPTPTSTPTETPSPTPTPTVTETPPPTTTPVVAPETLTPKPTLTVTPTATRPPEVTPATPSVLPSSGGGAISEWSASPWLALAAAGGLVLMLSACVVWSAKERRGQ